MLVFKLSHGHFPFLLSSQWEGRRRKFVVSGVLFVFLHCWFLCSYVCGEWCIYNTAM